MCTRQSAKLRAAQIAVILLALFWSGIARAQTPTSLSPSTPAPTITPVPVLIVTPAVTPTPVSPWPESVQKAWETVRALWATFGWRVMLLVLAAAFFVLGRKVLEELRDTWAKGIASWINDSLQKLLALLRPGPDQPTLKLLKDVFDKCERLEIKGIAKQRVTVVSLESIYVPLFTAGEAMPGLGLMPRGGEAGLMMVREEAERLVPVAELLSKHRCLVIVGEAGSGKSTFLRYVALTLARALRDRRPDLVRKNLNW
ncbi:MAG: hypothetical protein ACP5R2_14765, partial [Anaerolineae bacterium]